MKISYYKTDIAKALHSDYEATLQLKYAIATVKKENEKVKVTFKKPALLPNLTVTFVECYSFECNAAIGISGICQAIDMHHMKMKDELMKACRALSQQLRNKADACIVEAMKIESLMNSK